MFLCHLAEPTHCYSCKMTKSRLHTPISTVVHAEVVCTPKFLPISIFLSHTLRSKITAPWNMSQHQNSLRISLETSVSYRYFQVRFFLVISWQANWLALDKQTGHGRGRDLVTISIFSLPRVVRSINVQCLPHPLRHRALIYGPDQPIRQRGETKTGPICSRAE